jgi:hypothetical protein
MPAKAQTKQLHRAFAVGLSALSLACPKKGQAKGCRLNPSCKIAVVRTFSNKLRYIFSSVISSIG